MNNALANTKHEEQRHVSFVKPTVVSAVFMMLLLLVMSLVFAALFALTNLPTNLLMPSAILMLAIACFAGGFFSARMTKAKGLTAGIIAGAFIYLILFLLSILFVRSGVGLFALAKLMLMLTAAAIGGISGVNLVAKRK